MAHVTNELARQPDREQLRQELLKLILKNEAERRNQSKAPEK